MSCVLGRKGRGNENECLSVQSSEGMARPDQGAIALWVFSCEKLTGRLSELADLREHCLALNGIGDRVNVDSALVGQRVENCTRSWEVACVYVCALGVHMGGGGALSVMGAGAYDAQYGRLSASRAAWPRCLYPKMRSIHSSRCALT